MYLEEVILNYIKVDPNVYNCSFIDVIDPNFIKNKFALSGTVNVHLPEFNYYPDRQYEIFDKKQDEITTTIIENVIYGSSDKKNPTVTTIWLEALTISDIKTSEDENIRKIVNKLDAKTKTMLYLKNQQC